jgi:hypothetical protein
MQEIEALAAGLKAIQHGVLPLSCKNAVRFVEVKVNLKTALEH